MTDTIKEWPTYNLTDMEHPSIGIESSNPTQYRLAQKKDGTLVLQGAFQWHQGDIGDCIGWKDIPTVKLDY